MVDTVSTPDASNARMRQLHIGIVSSTYVIDSIEDEIRQHLLKVESLRNRKAELTAEISAMEAELESIKRGLQGDTPGVPEVPPP